MGRFSAVWSCVLVVGLGWSCDAGVVCDCAWGGIDVQVGAVLPGPPPADLVAAVAGAGCERESGVKARREARAERRERWRERRQRGPLVRLRCWWRR